MQIQRPGCSREDGCVCAARALAGGATIEEILNRNPWAEMLAYFTPDTDLALSTSCCYHYC
jgi:hypothetical protein